MKDREVFWCDCNDLAHSVVFEKDDDGDIIVFYQMKNIWPWYKRLYLAFGYVFGLNLNYCHYQDIVLGTSEKERLREYLSE